jgi:hypothetical protein
MHDCGGVSGSMAHHCSQRKRLIIGLDASHFRSDSSTRRSVPVSSSSSLISPFAIAAAPTSREVVRVQIMWRNGIVSIAAVALLLSTVRSPRLHVDAASTNPAFVMSADRTTGKFCSGSLIHPDLILTAATCRGTFLQGAYVGASST